MRVQEPLGVQPHEQDLLLLLGIDVKAVVIDFAAILRGMGHSMRHRFSKCRSMNNLSHMYTYTRCMLFVDCMHAVLVQGREAGEARGGVISLQVC